MKRFALAFMFLLPVALYGQAKDSAVAVKQSDDDAAAQAIILPAGDDGSPTATVTDGTNVVSSADANTTQQPNAKPASSSSPRGETAPKIPGSMVGYVDDAVVASQIRVRFDAGFHDNAPDRAEFFYAQCGCNGGTAPGPKPGLVADLNFQQLYFRGEYAPIRRFSIFTEVPVRWIQPQAFVNPGTLGSFPNQAGISDVTEGIKFAAVASESTYVTFQFQVAFPSGDARKGLGTNHVSVEPELLLYQKISNRASLEVMVGDTHPLGSSTFTLNDVKRNFAGDVFSYGIGPSYVFYKGERVQFAPVIELVGWSVLGGLETNAKLGAVVSADGINIVNLKVGARTYFGAHNSLYIGYGHQLTHDVWYKEILRVEYRYTF